MRIIGGKYKGLKLLRLNGTKIRPTSDRLKESLFSIITSNKYKINIDGSDVLDICSGTGSLGIKAFSYSLAQAGPITNTVKDSAIVLDAISGFDSKDSTSLNLKPTNSYQSLINDKFSFKDFVFGVPSSLLEEGLDTEVRSRFNELLSSLKSLGAKLIDIELPHAKFSVAT